MRVANAHTQTAENTFLIVLFEPHSTHAKLRRKLLKLNRTRATCQQKLNNHPTYAKQIIALGRNLEPVGYLVRALDNFAIAIALFHLDQAQPARTVRRQRFMIAQRRDFDPSLFRRLKNGQIA